MRTEQIEAFLTAAEHGSFAAAARYLHSHRSTLSAAVSALEDELNTELFQRSGNQLRLTPLGEAIRGDCLRLLHSSARIEQLCQQHSQGIESMLRVVRDDALPEQWWRRCISALQMTFPQTSLDIYLLPAQEHRTFIAQQIADIAIGSHQEVGETERIKPLRQLLVAATSHSLAKLPSVEAADLSQARQVCLTYLQDGTLVNQALFLNNYLGMTSYELIRDAVLAGAGWAVLPEPLVRDGIEQGTLKALPHTLNVPVSYLSCLYQGRPGQAATWLRNFLQQHAMEQPHPD